MIFLYSIRKNMIKTINLCILYTGIHSFTLPYHELINRKIYTPRQKTIIYDTF